MAPKTDVIEQLRARIAELEEENARLRTVPMKYRRMAFNAQLQDENNELRAQLAKAEQRVAEACALQVATETKFHWLDAARVAKEIRSGEYRKFMKEM